MHGVLGAMAVARPGVRHLPQSRDGEDGEVVERLLIAAAHRHLLRHHVRETRLPGWVLPPQRQPLCAAGLCGELCSVGPFGVIGPSLGRGQHFTCPEGDFPGALSSVHQDLTAQLEAPVRSGEVWHVELHGGGLAFVPPREGAGGALVLSDQAGALRSTGPGTVLTSPRGRELVREVLHRHNATLS